eukprot:TRINITY_DN7239_c2_g1_i1.p1 TRINITY_DN7239_c2_g1~~TRINITY_DN7239_c2_g1_i1.p1  ORF type:complete len:408 (+),score=116.82 TRINITY_DN7239_c2_g1_i1:116-1339(+)
MRPLQQQPRLPVLLASFVLGAGVAAMAVGAMRPPRAPEPRPVVPPPTVAAAVVEPAAAEEPPSPAPPVGERESPEKPAPATPKQLLERLYRRRAGVYVNKARNPRLRNVVMVTMANWGFRNFFFNWECYARQLGFDYIVLSMDSKLHKHLGDDRSLLMDDMQGKQEWGSEAYFDLGCHKLEAIQILLDLGADVLFTDPDNVFLRDPQRTLKELTDGFYDAMFQADHPACADRAGCPIMEHLKSGKLINGGFYFYSSKRKDQMSDFLSQAVQLCLKKPRSKMCCDDQQAVNKAVELMIQGTGSASSGFRRKPVFCGNQNGDGNVTEGLQYCIFDPAEHPAGRHTVEQRRVNSLHANWILKAENKIKHLRKHNMWQWVDGECKREGLDENARCAACERYDPKPLTPEQK